jgi:hypothetical protein
MNKTYPRRTHRTSQTHKKEKQGGGDGDRKDETVKVLDSKVGGEVQTRQKFSSRAFPYCVRLRSAADFTALILLGLWGEEVL